ncbi:MAG: hypothetical protein LBM96_09440 [Methanobrevibacter sp.]|nr:hypothetical protein [Candidatus Methanoflexus mossambicus]
MTENKSDLEEMKKIMEEATGKFYDIIEENGHYYFKEKTDAEKIEEKLKKDKENKDHEEIKDSNYFKSKFILYYNSISPDKHKTWYGNSLENKINEVNRKFKTSFYIDLFDIDLDKINEKISSIEISFSKRRSVSDNAFENYIRMTNGIAREIILYYLDFLKTKEYEKEFDVDKSIKEDISKDNDIKNKKEAEKNETKESDDFNYDEFFENKDIKSRNSQKENKLTEKSSNSEEIINNLSGWKKTIFDKIKELDDDIFAVHQMYEYIPKFEEIYPNNSEIKSKIRQTLQQLRDLGLIEFISYGKYKKSFKISSSTYNFHEILNKADFDSQYTLKSFHYRFYEILNKADFDSKDISIPQANEFNKIITLCEELKKGSLSKQDITDFFVWNIRLSSYYGDAGVYLGIIERDNVTNGYCLSNKGKEIFNMENNERNYNLAILILEHLLFNKTIKLYLKTNTVPNGRDICKIFNEIGLDELYSSTTLKRRSSTVVQWTNWIINNFSNELNQISDYSEDKIEYSVSNAIDNENNIEDSVDEFNIKKTLNDLNGWNKLVFEKIIGFEEIYFEFNDFFRYIEEFEEIYPDNTAIKPSISNALTKLVSLGLIEKISKGKFIKKFGNENYEDYNNIGDSSTLSRGAKRNLKKGIDRIEEITTNLALDENIKNKTKELFEETYSLKIQKGISIESVAVSCAYITLRKENTPYTLDEIATITNLDKLSIGRTYKKIAKELDIKLPIVSPFDYLNRFSSKVAISDETKSIANDILNELISKNLIAGKDPAIMTIATLYVASICSGIKPVQRDFANKFNTTEVTIRKKYKEIKENINLNYYAHKYNKEIVFDISTDNNDKKFNTAKDNLNTNKYIIENNESEIQDETDNEADKIKSIYEFFNEFKAIFKSNNYKLSDNSLKNIFIQDLKLYSQNKPLFQYKKIENDILNLFKEHKVNKPSDDDELNEDLTNNELYNFLLNHRNLFKDYKEIVNDPIYGVNYLFSTFKTDIKKYLNNQHSEIEMEYRDKVIELFDIYKSIFTSNNVTIEDNEILSKNNNNNKIAFQFLNKEYTVNNYKDLLLKVIAILKDEHKFNMNYFELILTNNNYFSTNKNDLTAPKLIEDTDIYVDLNLNDNEILKLVEDLLKLFFYDKNDFELIKTNKIETNVEENNNIDLTNEIHLKIINCLKNKHSLNQIAIHLNIDENTIKSWLDYKNIKNPELKPFYLEYRKLIGIWANELYDDYSKIYIDNGYKIGEKKNFIDNVKTDLHRHLIGRNDFLRPKIAKEIKILFDNYFNINNSFNDENKSKSDEILKITEDKISNNEEKYKQIAKTDPNWDNRRKVLKHIKNQEFLKEIAFNDDSYFVQKEAIKHIDKEELLKEIAKVSDNYLQRKSAIAKISDEEFLVNVSKEDTNQNVKNEAIKKLESLGYDFNKSIDNNKIKNKNSYHQSTIGDFDRDVEDYFTRLHKKNVEFKNKVKNNLKNSDNTHQTTLFDFDIKSDEVVKEKDSKESKFTKNFFKNTVSKWKGL